jgi:hypothetical protein
MESSLTFCCSADNDLYQAYVQGGGVAARVSDVTSAVACAAHGTALLLLADGYPGTRTVVPAVALAQATSKGLRVFVEYPESLPGVTFGEPRRAQWERLVIADDRFGPDLAATTLLSAHACSFLPVRPDHSLVGIARVAGYDRAVFGLPATTDSAIFELPGCDVLVATTRLSGFRTGRYAPAWAWTALWQGILRLLGAPEVSLRWTPVVRPSHGSGTALGLGAEREAVSRARRWHLGSGLLLTAAGEREARAGLAADVEAVPRSSLPAGSGDGSHGLLEGFESTIQPDGNQHRRVALRADCVAETAMVLATSEAEDGSGGDVADNLLDYLFGSSGMCSADRGDPDHPAYGLIAWGVGTPAWEVANYGDDNARVLLACLVTSARRSTARWTEPVLRAVLANFRTTGRLGFRGDRIDMPELSRRGWRDYFEGSVTNLAPHFESYLWACYLWAYEVTGHAGFLERTKAAIGAMMDGFPGGWRRNDVTEPARMLLPLSWLVRVKDTPLHRSWLDSVAADLLRDQHASGAIPERELGGPGLFRVPHTNEEYGVTESPIIQQEGDPASDQLYTTGFALLGLHEAAAATGDARLREHTDRLADYLVRIQTRSEEDTLDGTWLRAFDFERWEYWGSSGDLGWGAWCVELGWGQAWIAAALALRQSGSSLWEEARTVVPGKELIARLLSEMLPDCDTVQPDH